MEKAKIGLNTQEYSGHGRWSFIIDILNRMEKLCEKEDIEGISAAQFGFRKGLSTHHALKKVEESLGGSSRRQKCV